MHDASVSGTPGTAAREAGLQRLILPATLFVLVLAFSLSAATLGRENFWIDELSSLYFSEPTHSFADSVFKIWPTETNPPLYYLYLYLWRHLVPYADESSIRAASLIPAILACLSPLLYSSRVMAYERRLAVTLLLACSHGVLYYAAEARGYALLLLFAVNASFLFLSILEAMRSGSGRIGWRVLLLSLLSVAAAWTHLFGILLAAALFAVLTLTAIVRRRHIPLIVGMGVLTGAASIVWPVSHAAYMQAIASDHWFISLDWENLLTESKALAFLAFGYKWSVMAIAGLTLAALVHGAAAARANPSSEHFLLLALLVFVALVGLLSLDKPLTFSRYFVITLPAIYMIVVEATGGAAERALSLPVGAHFAVMLVFAAALAFAWPVFVPANREDWRQPATVVNETSACRGAPILVAAAPPDSGDPVYLYSHYLDPAQQVRLIPIQSAAALDPQVWNEVKSSPCPVKIWAGHIDPWRMRQFATELGQYGAGYRMEAYRKAFLYIATRQTSDLAATVR